MFKKIRQVRRGATGLVCTILVINLHVMAGGCGAGGGLSPDGKLLIPLTADKAMSHSLAGSPFAGATAVEVDTVARTFVLVNPGVDRHMSGSYSIDKGALWIKTLNVSRDDLSADISLDSQKHITRIETSAGYTWERPPTWTGLPVGVNDHGIDAYIAANIELVEMAKALDGGDGVRTQTVGGGSVGGGTVGGIVKGNQSSQTADLASVLGVLGLLLAAQAAIANWPVVVFVLEVVLGVQLLLSIAGLAPATGPPAASTAGEISTGEAVLRVTNNRTDETPIWFVTLLQDQMTGQPGGNVLGDEAIPAGTSRDFNVPAGTRDISIIVPSGVDCFVAYKYERVALTNGVVTELTTEDGDEGSLFPDECDNGG